MTTYESLLILVAIGGLYLQLWNIQRNHLQHILNRLGELEQRVANIEGKLDR